MAIFKNIKLPSLEVLSLAYRSLSGWEGWLAPAQVLPASDLSFHTSSTAAGSVFLAA